MSTVTEEIADCRNGDVAAHSKDSRCAARGTWLRWTYPQRRKVVVTKGWRWPKDEDGPEEVTKEKHFTLKELTDILCDIKCSREENLKADPGSEEYNLPRQRKDACSILQVSH